MTHVMSTDLKLKQTEKSLVSVTRTLPLRLDRLQP